MCPSDLSPSITLKLAKGWHEKLKEELSKPYIQELKQFLAEEKRDGKAIYPPQELIFQAFLKTPYEKVSVVIVGQDPYHGEGQAHGLSFSVPPGFTPPPSLKNIFKEIKTDLALSSKEPLPEEGCLEFWTKQGVFLLNAILTVRAHEPQSHHGRGWERFTDAVIAELAKREDPIVFLLWGAYAKQKCAQLLSHSHHFVLTAAHPSPYSASHGFFGCRHFSQTNALLERLGKPPIQWLPLS